MRFGNSILMASTVFATMSYAQTQSQWSQYDDMILRNIWKKVMGSFLGIAVRFGCSQFTLMGSTAGYASFVPFLGADDVAVEAVFTSLADDPTICIDYASQWWEQVWHIDGKGNPPFILDTSAYIAP